MSTLATSQETAQIPLEEQLGSTGQTREVAGRSTRNGRSDAGRDAANRAKEEYGGVKAGLAFLGWLTATGTAVILTALIAGGCLAVSVVTANDTGNVTGNVTTQTLPGPETLTIVGATVLLIVLFVAYFCGGYVAGRMARFNGLAQGLAVWLWAVVITSVVVVVAALTTSHYDVLSRLNSFPRLPVSQANLTSGGLIALGVVAAGSLAGALVGGLVGGWVGMHFHRKIARAELAA